MFTSAPKDDTLEDDEGCNTHECPSPDISRAEEVRVVTAADLQRRHRSERDLGKSPARPPGESSADPGARSSRSGPDPVVVWVALLLGSIVSWVLIGYLAVLAYRALTASG
jgi:hypothetical protein